MGLITDSTATECFFDSLLPVGSIDIITTISISGTELGTDCVYSGSGSISKTYTRKRYNPTEDPAEGEFYLYVQGCCAKNNCQGRFTPMTIEELSAGTVSITGCADPDSNFSGDLNVTPDGPGSFISSFLMFFEEIDSVLGLFINPVVIWEGEDGDDVFAAGGTIFLPEIITPISACTDLFATFHREEDKSTVNGVTMLCTFDVTINPL